jgi:hypothetical protein
MRRVLIIFVLLLFLAGCSQSVKYVCSDGSVVKDASDCPSPEETQNAISTPEVITKTDTYNLKKSESMDFDGKSVKLKDVFDDGRTIVDVSGVAREIKSTKYLEIINGLEVTVMGITYQSTDPDASSATLKLNKLALNQSEYLFFNDQPQVIDKVEVTLSGVTPSYIIVDTGDVLGMKIYPGSSKVVSGINITNVRAFPRGVRSEDYAILRVVKA